MVTAGQMSTLACICLALFAACSAERHIVALHLGALVAIMVRVLSLRAAAPIWFLLLLFSDLFSLPALRLEDNLDGKIAVVTGASQGSGRGFALGLVEAGATVYVTGRKLTTLQETCNLAPGPGKCIPRVVDSANDNELELFFERVGNETNGRLDILVNNAYAGVGWWSQNDALGKPFWDQGIGLYDAIYRVGVRSHYKATILGLPLLKRAKGRGLIVNTNSAGCLMYLFNVPYGMGKCSIDKMTSGMAIELRNEGVDVVSWWAKEPIQTAKVKNGGLEGSTGLSPRRGLLPGIQFLMPENGFRNLFHTALAGTLFYEGRALAAFARDPMRTYHSGLAVQVSQLGQKYGLRDERGIRSPMALSVKFVLFSLPPFTDFVSLPNPETLTESPLTASPLQRFIFGTLPDLHIPQWVFKVLQGNPATFSF